MPTQTTYLARTFLYHPSPGAMRHADWTALMTRECTPAFADDFSDAHEDGNVNLTIEGSFDHVTNKIDNAIGIELAKNNQ